MHLPDRLVFLSLLEPALLLLWTLASLVYVLKFVFPSLRRWINYGKLQHIPKPKGHSSRQRQDTPASSLFWPVEFRRGWILFYGATAFVIHPLFSWLSYRAFPMRSNGLNWLFQIQLLRRLFECLFVHIYTPGRKMSLVQIAGGLGFYTLASASVCLSNVRIGDARFLLVAVPIFLVASGLQMRAHWTLRNLRIGSQSKTENPDYPASSSSSSYSNDSKMAKKTHRRGIYAVPEAFPFNYILCPHYSAEIALYCLFAWLHPSPSLFGCCCFVAINLHSAARETKAWYLANVASWMYLHPAAATTTPATAAAGSRDGGEEELKTLLQRLQRRRMLWPAVY